MTCRHFYNWEQSNPANSSIARIELPSTVDTWIAPCTNTAPHSQTSLKIAFVYLAEGEPKFQRTLQNTLWAGKIMTHIFHNYRIWPRGASSKQNLLAVNYSGNKRVCWWEGYPCVLNLLTYWNYHPFHQCSINQEIWDECAIQSWGLYTEKS